MSAESSLRADIVEVGRRMYARGYTASNDGNISVRLENNRLLFTRNDADMIKFSRASKSAFAKPEARDQARKAGFEIVAGTPEQLAARVAAEVPAVRDLVLKAGIKTE